MNKSNPVSKYIPLHGWLILDKPLGLTSTQAIGKARRFVGGKKVGHGGTLDPLASGILPLAFGEATKVIPYVMDGDKEYLFSVCWGEQRTTDDAEGDVMASSPSRPDEKSIRDILPDLSARSTKPRRRTQQSRLGASAPMIWPVRASRLKWPPAKSESMRSNSWLCHRQIGQISGFSAEKGPMCAL